MGSIPRVFHHSAVPISVQEFADAVRAACPPRHPRARHTSHRRVGIATSGGVDSMALAFLFSQLRTHDPDFILGDNPCGGVDAFIIDHKLRPNSDQEAENVANELSKLRHIAPKVLTLDWGPLDPGALRSVETAARRLRYRILGRTCAWWGVDNLFLGHHADDVHETVLMRLLAGHPSRGLAGMRPYSDIPECYDLHGVYQSGFPDMMRQKKPPLTFTMRKREVYHLRKLLLSDMRPHLRAGTDEALDSLSLKPGFSAPDAFPFEGEEEGEGEGYGGGGGDGDAMAAAAEGARRKPRRIPELPQLEAEDGGVRICRPFLGFEKDRLIATCEQGGVRWFEDPTNADPSLTTRNAVRHMVRGFALPPALGRPAVLRLSGRVRERVRAEEEDAGALLARATVVDFRSNAGTLAVEFPDVQPGGDLERARTVAGLLARRVIAVVSPETQSPTLPSLQGTVSRLFPALATPSHPTSQPSSFVVAGVLFTRVVIPRPSAPSPTTTTTTTTATTTTPTTTTPSPPRASSAASTTRWALSRAPYTTSEPLPTVPYHQPKGLPTHGDVVTCKPHWTFIRKPWGLFDGRFWVRLRLRLAGTFTVAPFRAGSSAAFRAALPRAERDRLDALLAAYAPGKTRYTLPAVYYEGKVDLVAMEARVGGVEAGGLGMMVALPSLGVHLPGLEKLVGYEVRYKKIDRQMLEKCHIPGIL